MGFKVADEFRTNELSHKPGGSIVEVVYHDWVKYPHPRVRQYDKIKDPWAYIKIAKENPEVKDAYIKE